MTREQEVANCSWSDFHQSQGTASATKKINRDLGQERENGGVTGVAGREMPYRRVEKKYAHCEGTGYRRPPLFELFETF